MEKKKKKISSLAKRSGLKCRLGEWAGVFRDELIPELLSKNKRTLPFKWSYLGSGGSSLEIGTVPFRHWVMRASLGTFFRLKRKYCLHWDVVGKQKQKQN